MTETAAPLRLGFVRGVAPSKWQERWNRVRSRRRLELVPLPDVFDIETETADMVLVRTLAGTFPEGSRTEPRTRHAVQLYEEQVGLVVARESELADEAVVDAEVLELVRLLDHPWHDPSWPDVEPWEDPAWKPTTLHGALELVATGLGGILMPMPAAKHLSDKRAHRVIEVRGIDALPRVFATWQVADDGNELQELIGVLRGRTARSSR